MALKTISKIGSGGFGLVERVEDEKGQHFARKSFVLNQPGTPSVDLITNVRKRFIREAELQRGVRHRNIVPVFSLDEVSDPPFFIMPLADGSLGQAITRDKTLGGHWRHAMMDIMSGLEEIHSMGIYHRDLKPANVLVFTDSATSPPSPYYAIGDFGLMSYHDTQLSSLTTPGMAMTSDFYTAPEITRQLKNASVQSDIYSLGCILHDFVGIDTRVPCSEIQDPSPYADILLKCTRREPARRFQTVAAVRDAVLAMGTVTLTATGRAGELAALIDAGTPLKKEQWQQVEDLIEKDLSSNDARALLQRLTLARVEELCAGFPDVARRLALNFASWVRSGSFDWDDCDGLANRLERFIALGELNLEAESIMALLYMGTGHNRWYVERRFVTKVSPAAADGLVRRIGVEFRADGTKACGAVSHLERSIGYDRSAMHPHLVTTLNEICK